MFYAPKIIVKYSTVFLTAIENVHDCVQLRSFISRFSTLAILLNLLQQ
jgi:hypothetical protein